MRAVIFANGQQPSGQGVLPRLQPEDLIIAADGGGNACRSLGLRPAVVIGDFDSISPDVLQFLASQGAEMIRFPAAKDFTDLELALQHAISLGVDQILVFGALGLRWDQTLANLLLPALPAFANVPITLVDGDQEISLIGRQKKYKITGRSGDTVSLIPISGDVTGVATHGLEYPLKQETLYLGSSRSVSNVLLGEEASVEVENGLLVCVVIHQP